MTYPKRPLHLDSPDDPCGFRTLTLSRLFIQSQLRHSIPASHVHAVTSAYDSPVVAQGPVKSCNDSAAATFLHRPVNSDPVFDWIQLRLLILFHYFVAHNSFLNASDLRNKSTLFKTSALKILFFRHDWSRLTCHRIHGLRIKGSPTFPDVSSYRNAFSACMWNPCQERLSSWARASQAGSKLDQGGVIQQPIVARAALVVPPLILNKLHYPGCQNGRNIIHPGLSSQAHSNTPAFSLYLLILPNKKIELAYFQLLLLFYFSTTFSPTQIKPKLCGREGHPVSKAS